MGSTQSFFVLILSAVVGRFLDAGYHRSLIVVGSILVILGSFLLSIVNGEGEYREGNYALIWVMQGVYKHKPRSTSIDTVAGFITGLGMACFFVTSSQGMHRSTYRTPKPHANYGCSRCHIFQKEEGSCHRNRSFRSINRWLGLPSDVSTPPATHSWPRY